MNLVHLVVAARIEADEFLTTEAAAAKWAEVFGFKVCEPHLIATDGEDTLFGKEE